MGKSGRPGILELFQKSQFSYELLFLEGIFKVIDPCIVKHQVDKRKRAILPTAPYIPPALLVEAVVLVEDGKLYPWIQRKT